MGGEGQPQAQAALVTRLIDFGYDVQQAIEAPRWLMGRTWGTPSRNLSLEGRISDEVVRELKRRGQPVQMVTDWNDNMGHAHAIRIDRDEGFLEGGADPAAMALRWATEPQPSSALAPSKGPTNPLPDAGANSCVGNRHARQPDPCDFQSWT